MSRPLISVLMPIKNVALYLNTAIESILNQSFTDFEFVIIDDNSTDESFSIAKAFAALDSRIKLYRSELGGISNTLNQGIKLAQANLIARMDGDDIALPHRFDRQFRFMQEHTEIDVCGSWIELFGHKNEVWHYRENDSHIKNLMIFKGTGFGHNAVMLRKSVFDLFKYESNFNYYEDYRLWLKMTANSNIKFHNIQETLVKYRTHDTQVRVEKATEQAVLREKIIRDFWTDLGYPLNDEEYYLLKAVRELDVCENKKTYNLLQILQKVANRKFSDEYRVFDQYLALYAADQQ